MAVDVVSTFTEAEATTTQSGRTRVYGIYFTNTATSGDLVVRDGGASGTIKIKIKSPAVADSYQVDVPGDGILFKSDVHVGFTTEQITSCTVFHSGGSNT